MRLWRDLACLTLIKSKAYCFCSKKACGLNGGAVESQANPFSLTHGLVVLLEDKQRFKCGGI